ncbi:MAG TPA: dTDP-4-dehydrorhamnose reductase [Xanthobacteraceae bacterium]|jgi:dTDP-4-dehydrorhamnose reductase
MPHRVFIAGERGQVARALSRAYSARGDVVRSAGRATADIADKAVIDSVVRAFRPDLVINAAAYTAVDKAEEEADEAFRVNRDGARHMATAARAIAAPLIHISTDYVFDGAAPLPYMETDATNPISIYGTSKLAGEHAIAAETADFVILRSSWIYSAEGGNFAKTMLRLAGERDVIEVVDDQLGAPTYAEDLAAAIVTIGESLLGAKDRAALHGVYHATASGETTWYGFASAIMAASAAKGGPSCALRPVTTNQFPARARRPANSRLDGSKLARTFGVRLPNWEISLERCLDRLIVKRGGANS